MKKIIDEKSNTELNLIPLQQIGEEINLRNMRSIRKWLVERGITIHKLSSKSYVYRIDYELHIEKPYVLNLRRNNPKNWKEMYKAIVKSEALYNLMMIEIEQEVIHLPTTLVSLRNRNDEKLLMELVA
jgi:hypothetical protein